MTRTLDDVLPDLLPAEPGVYEARIIVVRLADSDGITVLDPGVFARRLPGTPQGRPGATMRPSRGHPGYIQETPRDVQGSSKESELVPAREAAKLLGLTRATFYRRVADGTIPTVNMGTSSRMMFSRRMLHRCDFGGGEAQPTAGRIR